MKFKGTLSISVLMLGGTIFYQALNKECIDPSSSQFESHLSCSLEKAITLNHRNTPMLSLYSNNQEINPNSNLLALASTGLTLIGFGLGSYYVRRRK